MSLDFSTAKTIGSKTSTAKATPKYDVRYSKVDYLKTKKDPITGKNVKTTEVGESARFTFGRGFMKQIGIDGEFGLSKQDINGTYCYKLTPITDTKTCRYFKGTVKNGEISKSNFITDTMAEEHLIAEGLIQNGVENANLTLVRHNTEYGTFFAFAVKNTGTTNPVTVNAAADEVEA